MTKGKTGTPFLSQTNTLGFLQGHPGSMGNLRNSKAEPKFNVMGLEAAGEFADLGSIRVK